MGDGDALVEDEAGALPEAFLFRNIFQVFQNPALEMIDILIALGAHEGGCLFTANAAGAEHGDGFALVFDPGLLHPARELAEGLGLGIDGSLERADADFIVVAGVDQNRVGIRDQLVPVRRIDIGAHSLQRVDVGNPHRDDFLLQPHLHASERHPVRTAFLVLQRFETGNCPKMREHGVDG